MSKRHFSEEQVKLLRLNPFVEKVDAKQVYFSDHFKKLAYAEILLGKSMSQIFREHGIDTEALGTVRIYKFKERLMQHNAAKSASPAEPCRSETPKDSEEDLRKRVAKLEHRLAYTTQVVEFLKKIYQADMEAREKWASKHRQK